MNITHSTPSKLVLKSKNATTVLDDAGVHISDHLISGPGEYDISSVQCEGQAMSTSVAYFVRDEDLLIAYLPTLEDEFTKLDDASECDILVIGLRSDSDPAKVKSLIKAVEPGYVYLLNSTPEFVQQVGITTQPESTLKASKAGLPLEGTFVVTPA